MEADGTGALKPVLKSVPQINAGLCTGCGRCVSACPGKLISLEVAGYRKFAVIHETVRCASCGCCVLSCPVEACYCILP